MVSLTLVGTGIGIFIVIGSIIQKNIGLMFGGLFVTYLGVFLLIKQFGRGGSKFEIISGIILVILLISCVTVTTIDYMKTNHPSNEDICSLKYSNYNLEQCKNNLQGIEVCSRINATHINTKRNLFSSPIYTCNLNGTIVSV